MSETEQENNVVETPPRASAAPRTEAGGGSEVPDVVSEVPETGSEVPGAGSEAPDAATFTDFGVDPQVVASLAEQGIVHPFPIQALTLPVALAGRDIIGQAKTGTGKTLGFGIPLLANVIDPDDPAFDRLPHAGCPQALVIVPTRELANQVAGDLTVAAAKRSTRIVEIYGGRAYEPQVAQLAQGAEVVVGTPGRLIDLLRQRILVLSGIKTLVLDEADEMLDLGFLPDVETLLSQIPTRRQTMLFSATMPGPVVAMARRYMSQPTHIRAQDPTDDSATVKDTRQLAYRAHALNKVEVLARILQAKDRGLTIVFVRTKRSADNVAEQLDERGFACAALHGDLGQGARERALRAFRSEKIDVLVATDVAARGIDIDNVTHVINYQCPNDEKTYIHRIGRTGRAGNKGIAITLVDWDDLPRWNLIVRSLELTELSDPPETYHTSEHLYSDLAIPSSVSGKLPRSERKRPGLAAEKVEDLGETGQGKKRRRRPSGARGSGSRGSSGSGSRRRSTGFSGRRGNR